MASLRIKRGVRAAFDAIKTALGIKESELYHITDENRVELGTGTSTSVALALVTDLAEKVTGPSSATSNTLPRFSGATGKLVKGSDVSVDDIGNMVLPSGALQIGGQTGALARLWVYANASGSTNSYDAAQYVRQDGTNHIAAWTSAGGSTAMLLEASGNLALHTGALVYGAGSYGTATQDTSKTYPVTINKPSGTITMHNAALANGASVTFPVYNTFVTAQGTTVATSIDINSIAAYGYVITVQTGAGLAYVTLINNTGATRTDAVAINFVVSRGGAS